MGLYIEIKTGAICEKWQLDRRYYYCRTGLGFSPNDRRVFLAVDDGFGELVEVVYG